MDKPSFAFATVVVPTEQAFKAGVFSYMNQGTIRGVVLHCQDDSVRVCLQGRKTPTDYHIDFWQAE